jgi:hypothetical protein
VSGQLHTPAAFPPRKEPAVTHWIGGWVGPRAVWTFCRRGHCLASCRESNPGRPARSPSLYRLSYPGSSINILRLLAKLIFVRVLHSYFPHSYRVPVRDKKFVSASEHPDLLWGPPSLLLNWHRVLFPRG